MTVQLVAYVNGQHVHPNGFPSDGVKAAVKKQPVNKTNKKEAVKKPQSLNKKPANSQLKNQVVKKNQQKAKPAVKPATNKIAKKPTASAKAVTKISAKKSVAPKVEAKTAEVQARRQESRAAVEAFEKALKLFSRQDFASAKAADS